MNSILMVAVAGAGLGFVLVLFKLLKKGGKLASKLPLDYLLCFLIFGLMGLTGFFFKDQIADTPLMVVVLLMIVAITVGTQLTGYLYNRWEWGKAAGFGKKLGYQFSITLVSMIAFVLIFLLCEHRGFRWSNLGNDLVWLLAASILVLPLPLMVAHLHELFNRIPKIKQLKQIFVPTDAPPFIETGAVNTTFHLIIPLDYRSEHKIESTVAVPINKTLAEAFHYKLHEHNVVKRFTKKIILAEGNKRSRMYGWAFYRTEKVWWGWFTRKYYLNPKITVGANINQGEKIFVEREKIWQ